MTLAADAERERAVATLRVHYVQGRLTLDDFAARAERALTARTMAELRASLRGLPWLGELVVRARTTAALLGFLAMLAATWVLASMFLLAAFTGVLVFGDRSGAELLSVPLLWLLLSWGVWFAGRRRLRRS